jgi:hypothetical protein
MVQWKMEELLIESNELTKIMSKAKSSAYGNK